MKSREVADVTIAVSKMGAGVCEDGNDPVERKEVII